MQPPTTNCADFVLPLAIRLVNPWNFIERLFDYSGNIPDCIPCFLARPAECSPGRPGQDARWWHRRSQIAGSLER